MTRRSSHTFSIVLSLVAGLTVSIATFSILMSLLHGDQPGIINRKELVRTFVRQAAGAGEPSFNSPLSVNDFAILRQPVPALGSIAVEGDLAMAAVGHHEAIGLTGAFISGKYFEVLGTTAHLGRLLTTSDERPDAPPVAVVSEHFWRTNLDAQAEAIGTPVLLAGRSFTVIGVAPPRFHGLHPLDIGQDDSHGIQVWIALQHSEAWPGAPAPDAVWLSGVGRLRDGFSSADARSQMAAFETQLSSAYPATRSNTSIVVRGHGFGPGDTPLDVLIILGAILGLPLTVLGISCANVANLQLARATERAQELSVRLSFGATHGQLVRLLTTEIMVLVMVAVFVSAASTIAILHFVGPYLPIKLTIDWQAAAFSLLLMLATTFSSGLTPAWLALRRGMTGRGRSRLRSTLVIAQVTLSLMMLFGSAVLLRSVNSMELEAPLALRSQIVAELDPGQVGKSPTEARLFAEALQERLKRDPRVTAVSISRARGIRLDNRNTALVEMTPSWLDVMSLPILTGRALTTADGPGVALVSARLAESIAGGGSPLGRVLDISDGTTSTKVEVVGVVADNRTRPMQIGDRPDPVVYVALPADISSPFTLRIRTGAVDAVRADLRTIVRELDPRLPWLSIGRGEESYLNEFGGLQYVALSVGGLGLLALTLASTGLYAVMAYLVMLRRKEIGVRMAVGADPRHIVAMVLRQALTLVLSGTAIGLALAIPLGYGLRAVFVGTVTPLDPVALIPTVALLIVAGTLAAAIPARRASRVDPITTLRQN